jgi:sec-independent protein translocase protein TatA
MNLGFKEILLIVLIILILFGAKRIPEVMKAMGQGLKEFKKASKDITGDDDDASASKPSAAATPSATPTAKSESDKPA